MRYYREIEPMVAELSVLKNYEEVFENKMRRHGISKESLKRLNSYEEWIQATTEYRKLLDETKQKISELRKSFNKQMEIFEEYYREKEGIQV